MIDSRIDFDEAKELLGGSDLPNTDADVESFLRQVDPQLKAEHVHEEYATRKKDSDANEAAAKKKLAEPSGFWCDPDSGEHAL